MANIPPFGTTNANAVPDLVPIKLFGCTVVDFNISADWSSQGGNLSCKLIESDTDRDRLTIPVLGSPVLFEVKKSTGHVIFQYIGIVDSFSRSASNSKTYSVNITSPLKILDSTSIILNGYTGLGSSLEGLYNLGGLGPQDFGHNNSSIVVNNIPGVYHWWNVSNLINVFGILENDDPMYRVPNTFGTAGTVSNYGDFGFSGQSSDGLTLIKLMWALHIGINHLPILNSTDSLGMPLRQKTHGGNLLFGRHNYNLNDPAQWEAIPYYYHFDAIHFYNQVVGKLGPEYRVAGQYKTLTEIISEICNEANLEFFSYIDIYNDPTIGNTTLQENDPYIGSPAIFNWIPGVGTSMSPLKFSDGGNYGGTIRIQTIDKNSFINPYRPFSNIAYNLIGLEVPDLYEAVWASNHDSGIHPGRRPINDVTHGISALPIPYADPLDSTGIQLWRGDTIEIGRENWGFTKVGTMSPYSGGYFPVEPTAIYGKSLVFDPNQLSKIKIKNSDISIKLNDFTTMKVITGGYQTRMVHVPRNMLRHYWGDIILTDGTDPRQVNDVATDSLGLDETSTRKIPIITPLLDPRDIDDFILIDMKSDFGPISINGVLHLGVYAASLFEIRCAMSSFESWAAFFTTYKYQKLRNLLDAFYPGCAKGKGNNNNSKEDLEKSTERINASGGLGYASVSEILGLGNIFSLNQTPNAVVYEGNNPSGEQIVGSGSGLFGLGFNLSCASALFNIKQLVLPVIHQKVKEIGDTHYGKSWYAPVPYTKTTEDLDGDNLVGNFKRAWELTDSAYVEPSEYYGRTIPQSNMFISDGKVNPFINYDHNFIQSNTGIYDTSYATAITNLLGQNQQVCNFSEYNLNELCITKYGINNIIHAKPENISDTYSFMPMAYDRIYNRAMLPYSDILTGQNKKFVNKKNTGQNNSGCIPSGFGQIGTSFAQIVSNIGALVSDVFSNLSTNLPASTGIVEGQIPNVSGYFKYDLKIGIPAITNNDWLAATVSGLQSLDYNNDNGRFSLPFVQFNSSRVFLPVPKPGMFSANGLASIPLTALNVFLDSEKKTRNGQPNGSGSISPSGKQRQHLITEDQLLSVLNPFQTCVVPKSFNYAQVSTRYVYGPWMTSLTYIPFRGKVEYEQDEGLVPENFLIPTNFGPFGTYTLNQTSGFTGMNLAAQGRANAIDDFSLFTVEEGSITLPGAPEIKRIGESLYGLQQITDIKINISNDTIETTYSFKTIAPKFGKNNRELERKLTKMSNMVKKIKLR